MFKPPEEKVVNKNVENGKFPDTTSQNFAPVETKFRTIYCVLPSTKPSNKTIGESLILRCAFRTHPNFKIGRNMMIKSKLPKFSLMVNHL